MTSTPYSREKYASGAEKQRIMRNNKNARIRARALTESIKKESGCVRCGFPDSRALEFHHANPSEKSFGISQGVARGYSKERLLKEIGKCVVLCANCHAIEHYALHGTGSSD